MNDSLFRYGLQGLFKAQQSEKEVDDLTKAFFSRSVEGKSSDLYADITLNEFREVFKVAAYDANNPSKDGRLRRDIGSCNGLARSLGCSSDKAARFLGVYKDVHAILKGIRDSIV